MTRRRRAKALLRRVPVDPLRGSMRIMLGVNSDRAAPGEGAASRGAGEIPEVVEDVDTGAAIAWAVAGLLLFSGRQPPTLDEVEQEARRVLLALLMERTDGVTDLARLMGSTRTTARARLRAVGLYDRPAGEADDHQPRGA
jgi:hypothetical protein